jgi:hypothetical protein
MDASGVAFAHNMAAGFSTNDGVTATGAQIFGLTGRICGANATTPWEVGSASAMMQQREIPGDGTSVDVGKKPRGTTCAIRDWNVTANFLFGANAGGGHPLAPWGRLHLAKTGSCTERDTLCQLVEFDYLNNNLVHGGGVTYGSSSGTKLGPKPPLVFVNENVNISSAFEWTLDLDAMTLTIIPDGTITQSGCTPGGAGGEVDFSGAPRSRTICTPGPFENVAPGKSTTISLYPKAPKGVLTAWGPGDL